MLFKHAVSTRHKAQSLSTEREQRVSDSAKFLHCRKMKQGIGGKKKMASTIQKDCRKAYFTGAM